MHQIQTFKCFLSHLAVVIAQSTEARCLVENEDVVGAALAGDAPNKFEWKTTQIAKFMGPTWGPPGSYRPQMGPMLAPWTLLSGNIIAYQGASHIWGGLMVIITVLLSFDTVLTKVSYCICNDWISCRDVFIMSSGIHHECKLDLYSHDRKSYLISRKRLLYWASYLG